MIRAVPVWAGLMLVALGLLVGCGGEKKSTSSGNSKNYIRFENQFFFCNATLHIVMDACHQDFWMEPGEDRVVECVPEDESAEIDLLIEAPTERCGLDVAPWSGTISGGRTVTISSILTTLSVDIHD